MKPEAKPEAKPETPASDKASPVNTKPLDNIYSLDELIQYVEVLDTAILKAEEFKAIVAKFGEYGVNMSIYAEDDYNYALNEIKANKKL